MAPPSHSRGEPVAPRDILLALGLGLLALGLYLSSPIARSFGDGSLLVALFAAREFTDAVYIHALYLPLARALADVSQGLGFPLDPTSTLLFLSQLSGALGLAAAFLVVRGFGVGRAAALAATGLFAISPPLWFFADTIEVHTVHFAAVSLVALTTLFGPWRRPALAALLMAATLPLVFLSHQSGLLLFPGWILLAQVGRSRVAQPFASRTLRLGIAPLVAAALAVALVLNAHLRQLSLFESFQASFEQVSVHAQGHLLRGLWQGWLAPLALLWVPLLLGIRRLQAREARTLALLILPSLVFFLAWSVPERGAYSLGSATFLIVLVGRGLEALFHQPRSERLSGMRWATAALTLLVLGQALGARHELLAFDRADITDATAARAAAARVAFEGQPEPALFVSFDPRGQSVTAIAPSIHELSLMAPLRAALLHGVPPADFAQGILAELRPFERQATIVFDRSYTALLPDFPECMPFALAIESALTKHYTVREFPGPGAGLWLLECEAPPAAP